MPVKIESLEQLKKLCESGPVEVVIMLQGAAKSSKTVQHFPEGWEVEEDDYAGEHVGETVYWDIFHHISDSYCGYLSDEHLLEDTPFGEAMASGALYAHT